MKYEICYPFILNPTGGSFVSTKLLIENLDNKFNCRFVFGTDESAAKDARKDDILTDILTISNCTLQKMAEKTSVIDEVEIGVRFLPYIREIRKYLKDRSIDIVHVNDGLTAMIWGSAAKTVGIPVIWHVRSERPNPWDRIRLQVCDHLIFVAESNKQRFNDELLEGVTTSVVHNGVNLSSFSPTSSTYLHDELSLDTDTRLVGFVGNLVARKRPMLFVNSALEILENDQNIHFVLVGRDSENYTEKIYSAAQSSGYRNRIHIMGYRTDVDEIMPSLDLLVLTSTEHGEAFPRVPLEAMASGTPVVTTDTAGVSEAVIDGQTGVVMDTDPTPEEISTKIQRLLRDENRLERFSSAAASHAQEQFSAERYASEIKHIYDTLNQ